MARYDYRCTSCGTVFEVSHGMTERPAVSCPLCGGACEKVFTPALIEFKGSGFYNTDQRGGGTTASSAPKGSEGAGGPAAGAADAPASSGHACENCPHKQEQAS